MFREWCFISVLFCLVFWGSGFVCSLFPGRTAQFLSALQYRRDAFVHLIVFGATEKQVFLKQIFVDSLFHPSFGSTGGQGSLMFTMLLPPGLC